MNVRTCSAMNNDHTCWWNVKAYPNHIAVTVTMTRTTTCGGVPAGDTDHDADAAAHTRNATAPAMATSNEVERARGRAIAGAMTSSTKRATPMRPAPQVEYTYGHGSSVTQRKNATEGAVEKQSTMNAANAMRASAPVRVDRPALAACAGGCNARRRY